MLLLHNHTSKVKRTNQMDGLTYSYMCTHSNTGRTKLSIYAASNVSKVFSRRRCITDYGIRAGYALERTEGPTNCVVSGDSKRMSN